jgi:hypothetical protein
LVSGVHQFSQAVKQLASLANRSLDRAGIDIMKRVHGARRLPFFG